VLLFPIQSADILGCSVIITGIIKVILAYNPRGHIPFFDAAEVWATLHAGLAIVCACLPIMKPLVIRVTSAFATGNSTDRHGSSEPDGWNVILLSVGNTNSDCSVYSYMPGSKNHVDFKV
jgi:hypothetical protein